MAKAVHNTNISLIGDPNMLLPIEILNLPVRAENSLKRGCGIYYIGQLVTEPMLSIQKSVNIREQSLKEIATKLGAKGYKVGEGDEQFGSKFMATIEDIREAFEIPDDVEATTEWVRIEGREAVAAATNNAGKFLTAQFKGTIHLPVPYKVTDELQRAALKILCQKAFEIAVNHEIAVAQNPKQKNTLQQALGKHIPFDAASDYLTGAYTNVHIHASPAITAVTNHSFLNRAAKSLGEDMIKGFVSPVLAPKA